jgi:PAS domain S-box-containing protein
MDPDPASINYVDDENGFRRFVRWNQWALACAIALALVGVLVTTPSEWQRYLQLAFLVCVLLVSRWQERFSLKRSIAVLAVGVWLLSSAAMLQFAGIYSANVVAYPFTIAMAGWVLGRAWLIGMTGVTVIFIAAVGFAEAMGYFHSAPRVSPTLAVASIVPVILVTSFLTYSARQSLFNSRNRAIRLSEDLALQNVEVARRERDLTLLLNNVPAAVASFDAQWHLLRCNQRYADLFGRNPDEIVGMRISDYVPQLALEQLRTHWERALQSTPQRYRRFHVHPLTSAVTWLDVEVMPEMSYGAVKGLYAVLVDVTDKVQAEAEIRMLNEELELRVKKRTDELAKTMETLHESREELGRSQARATLAAMIASVSHELSTPIGNSVLVASTLSDLSRQMQQQMDSGQMRKSTLLELNRTLHEGSHMLQRNLARAETLLKNFKQVSADQASEQRRTFDLAEVVDEVFSSVAPSHKNSPHRVTHTIDRGILMDSFPGPLGQVVINLINNAFMHAFEGVAAGVMRISVARKPTEIQLQFTDNGNGIAADVLLHLFEPFFSTKIGRGGTGLGLSIVESIVRKTLGGSMQVRSVVGQGTTFEVSLPLIAPHPSLAL